MDEHDTERSDTVPAAGCGHCVSAITEALERVDGVERVAVDLASKRVTVVGRAEDASRPGRARRGGLRDGLMGAAVRLGMFVLMVGVVFVAALAAGSAVDPGRGGSDPPRADGGAHRGGGDVHD